MARKSSATSSRKNTKPTKAELEAKLAQIELENAQLRGSDNYGIRLD